MHHLALALAGLAMGGPCGAGCAVDTSQDVRVAPSAEAHTEDLLLAVERLTARAGEPVFRVRAVSDGARRDGAIVVRGGDPGRLGFVAYTERERRGVVVVLGPEVDARGIAHELGHAAGLKHHPDPNNLMYDDRHRTGWQLEEWQVDAFR